MSHHDHSVNLKNPGPLTSVSGLKTLMLVLAAVGVVTFAGALLTGSRQAAWTSYLINHFYFLSFAVGGLFFAALQWVTGAMWSAPVRRIAESFTSYLPLTLVTFAILIFGAHDLYEWTHTEVVAGDPILHGKAPFLNIPFFVIRSVVAIGIWVIFKRVLIGGSIRQDNLAVGSSESNAIISRNRKASPAFLIIFALTYTLMSFDLLMSLQPHWFSTIFGVYCFAGLFYSSLALLGLLTIWLKKKGYLEGIVNDNHIHDIGKLMFAFTIFWAYIGFSQFMLIWYANLPEETTFYIARFHGGWLAVSIFLMVGKFFLPFFLLLSRDNKRKVKLLVPVGIFMLIAQWIDMMWLVQPVIFPEGPHFNWIEVGVTAGFAGIFGFCVLTFLSRRNVVAMGDHRLVESVTHHHQ